MRFAPSVLASLALVFAACSDDGGTTIDAIDAIDATPIDAIDAPGCGSDFFFTGEFVSWDSTTTTFMGVFEARWTVRGAPFRTILTNPNGRVELCLDPQATTSTIDVSKPGLVPGIFVAQPAVFQPPGTFFFSSKGLTETRAATFYQSLGLTFDATKAHVLVQEQGTPMALSLTGNGTAFAVDNGDDLTWTPGSTGGLVLFANVDVGGGTATLSRTGAFVGPTSLPLEAGKITMTTIR